MKATQEQRILEILRARGSAWSSALDLAQVSLQYCARISALREAGHVIENKIEIRSGTKCGFYRLRPSTPGPPLTSQPLPCGAAVSLFGDLRPVRWADPEEG